MIQQNYNLFFLINGKFTWGKDTILNTHSLFLFKIKIGETERVIQQLITA